MNFAEKATVTVEKLVLPTYAEPACEELPMFAENRVHQRTSGNPYPNKIVARVDREHRADREYTAVTLENEYVRVVVLPEIGGRIYSATDKTTGYDFFYKQHVIKPALIGALGSWVSGGVEFNWPFHHRASGYMACDFRVEECADGAVICHLSEHDPTDRMKGMVSIVLRPGEKFFETRMRLYNRTDVPHSFLWWENAAVPVNEDYQIFFPQDVTYVNFHYLKSRTTFPVAGNGVFNGIPMKEPRDISYHKNTREATSYFASASDYDFFGGYDHGKHCGVVHIGDHHVSPGKKMFTWAYGQLSKSWENALTDTDGQYAELMAGSYSDNQPDFSWLAPYETKQFSQYWYPISEIGTPTFANLNCAFKIERNEGSGTLRVQPCRTYESATVRVLWDGAVKYECTCTLDPKSCAVFDLCEIPAYVTVQITARNDDVIAEYEEKRFDEYNMPEVITDMPEAAKMQSAQELYLAGVHVDQYRDPAVHPNAYWEEALKRDIAHIPSLISMARYEYKNLRLESARSYAERAVAEICRFNNHPTSGEAYYVYAQILEALGEYKTAYDNYYKASFAADCVSYAMTRVAVLDLRKKDWSQALRHAAWALDYGKNNSLAIAVSIIANREKGNTEEAVHLVKQALAADPLDHMIRFLSDVPDFYGTLISDPAQTCLDIAYDLDAMGRSADAKRLLTGLTEACPTCAYQMVWYAIGYFAKQLGEDATPYYERGRVAVIGPVYPSRRQEPAVLEALIDIDEDARMLLGCLQYSKRNYAEAVALWENCPTSYMARRNLAVAYFSHLNRKQTALELMQSVLAERPFDEALLYETVVLMNKMNVAPRKKINLIRAHTVTRDDIITELAKAYNQAGEYDSAIETLMSHAFIPCEGGEHAIADQYMFAYLAKGCAAMKRDDWQGALTFFREGQILPQSLGAGIWNHCKRIPLRYREALCLEALGKADESREIFEYIAETEIEYFSNMHLPELPYYRALSYDRLGMPLHSRKLINEYRHRWGAMIDVKDNGFFATTPFFISFVDDAFALRRAKWAYLMGLLDLYVGDGESARRKMKDSFAMNNDNLFALLYL
ncbi:MAG: DUF5107 domain-containing protein [Clostridia bacterium]|nr:DUF5107 domain-containing protein [Clostridia bacterium]